LSRPLRPLKCGVPPPIRASRGRRHIEAVTALIGLTPENAMTAPRRLAASVATLALLFVASHAQADLRPMSDEELGAVHAAGLPEPALRQLAEGSPMLPIEAPMAVAGVPDLANSVDRQQALAQAKLASATAQGTVELMRVASLPAMFTPLAPMFLPTLALPMPFLALPSKKDEHAGH
jgi:hypothetical protein